ncbi:MAG TPA: adenylate/guanylate cyclase domain-containing protein [Chitinophagales bacterium]|nr:adenylate/guanylate cyclase domain-containing protein [Chitinophagales bacterium]
MKGRRAIKFTQWLAIVITTMFVNVLSSIYNYFLYQLPTIQRINPTYSFATELIMNIVAAIIVGGLLGAFMVYYVQDRFSDKPYGYTIIILLVSVFVVLTVVGLAFMVPYVMYLTGKPITDPAAIALFKKLFFHQVNPALFVIFPLVALQQLLLQIFNKFGPGVFWKMVRGKYYKPKTEDRIFMFLDLNASTTIAEQLGNEQYHDLLKEFFADITNSILDHSGEIYQYLGDGIIINWSTHGDERDLRSIHCFFDMRKEIKARSDKYVKKFGLVPTFKAGLHSGEVVVGEIGIIKRDITYSGDVLNTCARIQGMCHELKSEVLVSNDFLKSVTLPVQFIADAAGSFRLKGKEREVELYGLSTN